MNRLLTKFVCMLVLLVSVSAFGQNLPAPEIQKGFTGFEEFQGTLNSDSKNFKLDSNAGYDFNKHFGIFAWVAPVTKLFRSATKRFSARSWAKVRAAQARARTALINRP